MGCRTAPPNYLGKVRAYADAMIRDGRDTYGTEPSPLFASTLNRKTMKIGTFGPIQGVRETDRSFGGANPQEEVGLYEILYRLSDLTLDPRYAAEADHALKFFFSRCQSPATGLMTWGEHLYWDFKKEGMGGYDARHEIKGEWPFWNVCYKLAPDPCWKFAIGQWDHQIADKKTGDFSRHATWSVHGPQRGADFPRYAGQMIVNWADAYTRKENANRPRRDELLTAIALMLKRMERNIKVSPTGYLLAATDVSHRGISWASHAIELARCLWKAAPRVNGKLAGRMKRLALEMDDQFHRMPHTITSGGGFVVTLDVQTGKARARKKKKWSRPFTSDWASGYGYGIHARTANRCVVRFRQLEKSHPARAAKYRTLALAAADRYVKTRPNTRHLLKPGAISGVINLMLHAHELTGDQRYLKRADYFGRLGIRLFLGDGLPLPRVTNQHNHYEIITGGPAFMRALLRLHETLGPILEDHEGTIGTAGSPRTHPFRTPANE